MFRQLQEWSVVIFVAGGVALYKGAVTGDVPSIAAGAAVTLAGLFFLAYRRWYNLSWLAVVVGGAVIVFCIIDRSTFLGQPVETPNALLISIGAVLVASGLICFTVLYRECSRKDMDCSRLGDGSGPRPQRL